MDGLDARDLTVVVIGLNSAATLEGCLASVRRRPRPLGREARVLYVDGGSRDESVAIARRKGAEVIQLVTDRPTAAKGRNAGWRAATTSARPVRRLRHPARTRLAGARHPAIEADARIACLFGQLRESNPSGSIYNEVCGCDWYIPPGDWRMSGGNALFRLEALREVDGSDEELAAGEEPDLCWRLRQRGWRIVCVDAVMAHHDLAMTGFRDYWKRAVRSGYAYGEIGLRYARTDDPDVAPGVHPEPAPPAGALVLVGLSALARSPRPVALAAVVLGRLAWKFRSLRGRIPGSGPRALYIAHLAFMRSRFSWGR